MTRLIMLIGATLLAGCGGTGQSLEKTVPATIDGWSRTQIAPLPAADAPDLVRQLGLDEAVSATYTGPSAVSLKIFKMKGQTSAFELIQKWRQSDGLASYNGPYFIVAEPGSGPDTGRLLQALQKEFR